MGVPRTIVRALAYVGTQWLMQETIDLSPSLISSNSLYVKSVLSFALYWLFCIVYHCKGCPQPLFISVGTTEGWFIILDRFIDSVLFLIQKVLSIRIWLVWAYSTLSRSHASVRFPLESLARPRPIFFESYQWETLRGPYRQAPERSMVDLESRPCFFRSCYMETSFIWVLSERNLGVNFLKCF